MEINININDIDIKLILGGGPCLVVNLNLL